MSMSMTTPSFLAPSQKFERRDEGIKKTVLMGVETKGISHPEMKPKSDVEKPADDSMDTDEEEEEPVDEEKDTEEESEKTDDEDMEIDQSQSVQKKMNFTSTLNETFSFAEPSPGRVAWVEIVQIFSFKVLSWKTHFKAGRKN